MKTLLLAIFVMVPILAIFVAIAVWNDRWIRNHKGGWYE